MHTLVRQTVFLSASHFVVRLIGFIMRIWLSRELGAQAMGLVELAQSGQMLLITPVVSGLPAAVTRMCAKEDAAGQRRILRTGVILSLFVSVPICLAGFAVREQLALWLGDIRTLPALLIYLPCIPILGVSCALNGYYYGKGKPVPPALSEILEQGIRFLLCIRLVSLLKGWPDMLRCAIPALGALAGEAAGLLLMLFFAARALIYPARTKLKRGSLLGEMIALALPLTGMRVVSSLMRTVNAVLIPARLQASGLTAHQALSQFGMMQGMMMPILMMPSFITCSLSMVASPELTRRQANGRPMKGVAFHVLHTALAIGLAAAAGVACFAPVFANLLYHQPQLLPLLRKSALLIPLFSVNHVLSGMMNGLGQQRQSLRIALAANLASVLLGYMLAATPMRLWGVIIAMAVSQALTFILSLRIVHSEIS